MHMFSFFHDKFFPFVFHFEKKFTFLMELVFYKIEAFMTSKEITIINHLIIPLFEIHVYLKIKKIVIYSQGDNFAN